MNRFESLVLLNMVPEIGTIRLNRLLEFFPGPQDILAASQEKLISVYGIGEKIAQKIRSLKEEDLQKELGRAKKLGLKVLTQDDAGYPLNLKYIYDPPIALYIKGEIRKEDSLAMGVVGSRRASFYGLDNARKFSGELAEAGFTIVSGMARGVDTYAHNGSLKAGGRTIAVMGSGFNRIYPSENKKLAERIAENGAVISEFPLDTEPFKQNFPRRNRLISGLSLGVLVVEAAQNSGALITADFALEQGKEVFCLPGRIDSSSSSGPNELIKQGAKLVSCAEDILEEFNLVMPCATQKHNPGQGHKTIAYRKEESRVYDLLSGQPLQLDELVEKADMDIPKISGILLRLQLDKLIKQFPGRHFARI